MSIRAIESSVSPYDYLREWLRLDICNYIGIQNTDTIH